MYGAHTSINALKAPSSLVKLLPLARARVGETEPCLRYLEARRVSLSKRRRDQIGTALEVWLRGVHVGGLSCEMVTRGCSLAKGVVLALQIILMVG